MRRNIIFGVIIAVLAIAIGICGYNWYNNSQLATDTITQLKKEQKAKVNAEREKVNAETSLKKTADSLAVAEAAGKKLADSLATVSAANAIEKAKADAALAAATAKADSLALVVAANARGGSSGASGAAASAPATNRMYIIAGDTLARGEKVMISADDSAVVKKTWKNPKTGKTESLLATKKGKFWVEDYDPAGGEFVLGDDDAEEGNIPGPAKAGLVLFGILALAGLLKWTKVF